MALDQYMTIARRPLIRNHLKNGNFISTPRQFTVIKNHGGFRGETKVFKTRYDYRTYDLNYFYSSMTGPTQETVTTPLDIPGTRIEAQAPQENFFAYWDTWGAAALVTLNYGGSQGWTMQTPSLDGGNLVQIEFEERGTIWFRQKISSFDKFRGKPLTFALSGKQMTGQVKVTLVLDGGTQIQSRPFFSEYFGPYSRLIHIFDVPLDLSKFEALIRLDGREGDSVAISGAMLAIGRYASDLPYADNPSDNLIPSGTIILWAGEGVPAGFRLLEDDLYLFPFHGDPNAPRGDMNRYWLGIYAFIPSPSRVPILGQNFHTHATPSGTDPYESPQPEAFRTLQESFVMSAIREGKTSEPHRPLEATYPDFQGFTEKILPDDHSHVLVLTSDPVEPPFIKVRICEKI